ncbi:MAG TPA: prolyl oligopeptidase family serine peptidase [Vicinamibacterales bacterium]|nr:prolyl oligopeptidase family serine peptidase [Vicinamibacterales bacterium]
MRTLLAISLTSLTLAVSAMPAAQRPASRTLTIDQLIDIRHPSGPQWSRDSKWIAFTWDRAGVSNLYVVPADGSAKPRALTDTDAPQGYFWSARSDGIQFFQQGELMTIPLEGGAARPLPGVTFRSPSVSRDGTRVAYVGDRGAIRVRSLTEGSDDVIATVNVPPTAITWIDDTRLALTGAGGRGETKRHEQTPEYSGSKIIYTITERIPGPPPDMYVLNLTDGKIRRYDGGPGGGFGGRGGPRWVDRTRFILDRQSPDYKRRAILLGSTEGGEPKVLTEDVKDKFWSMTGDARGGSQASPDGQWISFLSDRDGWDHLYVMKPDGGEPIQLTKGSYEAWRPSWSPNSREIAFDSNEGANPGQRHIRILSLAGDAPGKEIRTVTSGRGTNTDAQWSPDGRWLVYQHTDPQNSADLYVIDTTTPNARPVRLTDSMPAGVDRSQFVEPQLVQYPGPDGKPVPAYLFVPKNLDRARKHPAIVWVHGDGVNQNYDGWHVQRNYAVYYSFHQYLLQKGYVVLAPDYRGSIGYGSAWREGVYMDVGGNDFKDAAMSADYLKTLPYVDANRLGIWGLSYGGFFTMLAVTERPAAFQAAVNVAGVVDYAMYYEDPYHGGWTVSRIGTPEQNPKVYAQASPVSHVDRLVTPLLVLHGTADVNVPYLHSVRLIDALLKNNKGPLVEFMTYPGELHYFTREHVLRDAWTRVDDFFARHLKPQPAGNRQPATGNR